jgi:hypothetical protein
MQTRRAAPLLATLTLVLGCHSSTSNKTGGGFQATPANGTYLPDATAGEAYSETITFTGWGVAPFTITVPGNVTPAGMTLTTGPSSATLSGTPTTAGSGSFELEIVDSTGATQFLTYGFTIQVSTAKLALTPTTLPAGIVGVLYQQPLTLTGGAEPFTWVILSGGQLPPGLALSSGSTTTGSNAITGTPTTIGTFVFTIQVTDSSNPQQVGNFNYTITVN